MPAVRKSVQTTGESVEAFANRAFQPESPVWKDAIAPTEALRVVGDVAIQFWKNKKINHAKRI
jgi:hypothetical protein